MITHVVLYEPRPDLNEATRASMIEALTAAATAIPSVRRFRIGKRVRHGLPGYEQAATPDFSYVALIEFDNLRGLEEYLTHPSHAAAGRHFSSSAARAQAYDFDVKEFGETRLSGQP